MAATAPAAMAAVAAPAKLPCPSVAGGWRWQKAGGKGGRRGRRLVRRAERGDPTALQFLRWAAEREITVNDLLAFARPLERSVDRGRRVISTGTIGEGEVLVSLPVNAAATVELANDAPLPPELAPLGKWWDKYQRGSLRLAAKLVYEKDRLEPYLAMLPTMEEIQTPWTWSEEELRLLSPEVAKLARERKGVLESAATDLEALDCWGGSSPRELFFRANHGVTSRAFSGVDQAFDGPGKEVISLGVTAGTTLLALGSVSQGLLPMETAMLGVVAVAAAGTAVSASGNGKEVLSILPMVDQVNHASGPQPDLVLKGDSRRWELKAHKTFRDGEEIVFSYGEKDNDSLLLQHGFVEVGNPSDACILDIKEDFELSEATRKALEKASVVKLRFARNGACVPLKPAGDGGFLKAELKDGRPLAEVAPLVLKEAAEAMETGWLSESKDPEPGSSRSAALLALWRQERRRLLREAIAAW